ncbi:MAG: DegT/DnrJ/EryC1/StrS family aminotransferase [Bacteroidetes bacterium]|nr:DegT/DnrJ/EryC1/StrS family aminotransferase [Bacteroidota bacterium]
MSYAIWRNDMSLQAAELMEELLAETRRVLSSGKYVLGGQLAEFESAFSKYHDIPFTVGVASGTEALYLALKAVGVGEGAEVITTPFTFIGTVTAIRMCNAKPVFVDIDPSTYNIKVSAIEPLISKRTKAIMPVHLYGRIAAMNEIGELAKKYSIPIVEDAAQAHGSLYHGKKAGTFGHLAAFSFYPSKNLGAYGDAGAITTDNEEMHRRLKLMRNYGQETVYEQVMDGVNSRLDELQAAFLTVKLKHLDKWNLQRRKIADLYRNELPSEYCVLPEESPFEVNNYHVYVIRVQKRERLVQFLESRGIQTNIYYPKPLHLQIPNQDLGYKLGDFPESERASKEVLALPMYAEMPETVVHDVAGAIRDFYLG